MQKLSPKTIIKLNYMEIYIYIYIIIKYILKHIENYALSRYNCLRTDHGMKSQTVLLQVEICSYMARKSKDSRNSDSEKFFNFLRYSNNKKV